MNLANGAWDAARVLLFARLATASTFEMRLNFRSPPESAHACGIHANSTNSHLLLEVMISVPNNPTANDTASYANINTNPSLPV
jgi:hypothetical protein